VKRKAVIEGFAVTNIHSTLRKRDKIANSKGGFFIFQFKNYYSPAGIDSGKKPVSKSGVAGGIPGKNIPNAYMGRPFFRTGKKRYRKDDWAPTRGGFG